MIFDEFTLKSQIRAVPDFPKPGVVFRDITPLFQSPRALRMTVDSFVQRYIECRFQKTAALNVRSRLHYSSGGVGSIRQRRAAAGPDRVKTQQTMTINFRGFSQRLGGRRRPNQAQSIILVAMALS
ncbi:hypothetical protein L4530_22940, partial [Pseudomonas aeruginosa]|nr:hypothetical protein [Pseudomonas aeruginosa]